MPLGGVINLPIQVLWMGKALLCYVNLQVNDSVGAKSCKICHLGGHCPPEGTYLVSRQEHRQVFYSLGFLPLALKRK